jgi:3-hydroxymyristoyl/3-hydroxydecanoyl-(acyl carrier protein) dehydratase
MTSTDANMTLLAQHAAESPVATGVEGALGATKSKADLLLDAAKVAHTLPVLSGERRILMVFRQDRYAYAAALLGAWSRGYSVCLPPNQRGTTISDLLKTGTVGALLHDTGASGHLSVPDILDAPIEVTPLSTCTLPSPVAVTVMTSGTTGASVAWDKSAQQLLLEVAEQARTFHLGPDLNYCVTVPPSHLYGLLFGVLLPLVTGSAFSRNTPLLPGEVAAYVGLHRAQVLVSVPTHLRAIRTLDPTQVQTLEHVFSSAGPLPEETARAFVTQLGKPITEIFGSTETGGIAWRNRDSNPSWTPFGPVTIGVDEEQCLFVESPFAGGNATLVDGPHARFQTSDQVRLQDDGRFEHLGRRDGVVKVGGQRVTMPAMEDCLLQHPDINDVAIVAVEDDLRGHRLFAAVAGLPKVEAACRELLQAQFAASTLPRRFLFLDRLPRESNGKLMRSRVLRLFGYNDMGQPLSKTVECVASDAEGERLKASIVVPKDYYPFCGHFDMYPVLAGAVQIQHIVMPLVHKHRPSWAAPTSLRKVKFTERIEPGDTLEVNLTFTSDAVQFSLNKASRVCSAGTLGFESGNPA